MFRTTEEQGLLRQAADGYFRNRAQAGERGWSPESWRRLADELGILAAPFPEDLGGYGGTLIDATIIMESLGEHLIAQPFMPSVIMAGRAIASTRGERALELLGKIGSGELTVAIAYLETTSRGCVHDIAVRADDDGAKGFVINGKKITVSAAPWSSHFLISARTGGERRDRDGISLFLIEKDRHGVKLHAARTIDGWSSADVVFEGVRVGVTDLVGTVGNALPTLEKMLEEASVALCAEGVGLMRSMIAQTSTYALQRKQFGKALTSFQVIQHRLVDMHTTLEHAASLAQAAAFAVESRSDSKTLLVAAAKYTVNRALNMIGRAAIQTHGAIGMMDETLIAHYFRRSTSLQLQCGSAHDHLAAFAEWVGATIPSGEPDDQVDDVIAQVLGGDGPEADAFRSEVQGFVRDELTPELRELAAWETGAFATPLASAPWNEKLAAKGWVAPAWPVEYGGPGWTARQRQIFEEEMARAGAPRLSAMGLQMVAPVIMRYGSDEQKAYFLPRVLSHEDYWCQGYSEPNAGSDLAALQLQAARDGDDYVLNGSKIWTTFAQFANWIFVLARTAQGERRQDGISFLLVPMATPGITVRPFISISGEHEVNQVFFDDVRIPVTNCVGEENDGWQVAKYLLEFERGVGHQVPALVVQLARLREIAQQEMAADGQPLWESRDFRLRFAELEMQTLAIRFTEERLVYALPAGQNVGDFAASLMKLAWSEMAQEIDELTVETLGPYAAIDQQEAFEQRDATLIVGPAYARTPMRTYLNDRVLTIAGGSSEIQRTILAKLVLR
jgi:alkylation response protein AidB-like acyl-CoA dehydrogenase